MLAERRDDLGRLGPSTIGAYSVLLSRGATNAGDRGPWC